MSTVAEVAAAIRARESFVLTSHARPDGDAIGSQLALAYALESLGKSVRLVDHDPPPAQVRRFPGADRIEVTSRFEGTADAAIVLECGTLARPEVLGLDRSFIINIDHHPGNALYGALNWFDLSAAACTEMVAELVDELGVPWTREIATHVYLGIVTDTGGFRHGAINARTFALSERAVRAGVDPAAMARQVFDSFTIGRIKLTGALLDAMELHADNRLAVLYMDDDLLARCGATDDDTDNLVNVPLGAKDVLAVVFVKRLDARQVRVSLRSKGDINVGRVAALWGGGGHRNAAGCALEGTTAEITARLVGAVTQAISDAKT